MMRWPALPVLLAATLGCLRPSPALRYYTLQPIQEAPAAASGLALEVLPVRLPELLQRPQMLQTQGGALTLAETERWGNPLDQDMRRVLVANLGRLLGSDAVVPSPYGERVGATYRVELVVDSCMVGADGTLALEAVWLVTRPGTPRALALHRSSLREAAGTGAEALAGAHSRILATLSREIAAELLLLRGDRPLS